MVDADEVHFLKVLNGLASMFRVEIEQEALPIWWDAMRGWSLIDFKTAAAQLVKTSKFMPRPADFEQLRKAGRPTAGEAWARAVRYAASSAYRTKPEIGDELIDTAVRAIGGFQAIGMTDEDKLHFLETRFCEHYEQIEDRTDIRKAVPEIANHERKPNVITSSAFKKIGRDDDSKQ